MSGALVREVVEWDVEDAPARVVAGRAIGGLLSLVGSVLSLGSATSGAEPVDPDATVPSDPSTYLRLGVLRLRGPASWLPAGHASPAEVRATARQVRLVPRGEDRAPTALAVDRLVLEGATPRGPGRRDARAPWVLQLRDGEHRVELEGPWLGLSWVGHLAGWPQPSVPVS